MCSPLVVPGYQRAERAQRRQAPRCRRGPVHRRHPRLGGDDSPRSSGCLHAAVVHPLKNHPRHPRGRQRVHLLLRAPLDPRSLVAPLRFYHYALNPMFREDSDTMPERTVEASHERRSGIRPSSAIFRPMDSPGPRRSASRRAPPVGVHEPRTLGEFDAAMDIFLDTRRCVPGEFEALGDQGYNGTPFHTAMIVPTSAPSLRPPRASSTSSRSCSRTPSRRAPSGGVTGTSSAPSRSPSASIATISEARPSGSSGWRSSSSPWRAS